jgi:hypothetical protein
MLYGILDTGTSFSTKAEGRHEPARLCRVGRTGLGGENLKGLDHWL